MIAPGHLPPPASPMPFDLHAFISYAHIDNEPLEPGQPGWVSRFHAVLKTRLGQRLGEPARLWRDDKLRGDDVFGDEIRAQLPRAALLVSILTPRYVRSPWCNAEVDSFAAAAGSFGSAALAQNLYGHCGTPDMQRYASMTMCVIFVVGVITALFAPETKGQPLPDDE